MNGNRTKPSLDLSFGPSFGSSSGPSFDPPFDPSPDPSFDSFCFPKAFFLVGDSAWVSFPVRLFVTGLYIRWYAEDFARA